MTCEEHDWEIVSEDDQWVVKNCKKCPAMGQFPKEN